MFRRQRTTTGRHRRTGTVPPSSPDLLPAAPQVLVTVDDARARIDPVTFPIPLPLPAARLRPPERRLIRTV